MGGRDNFVVFEFSAPVVVDRAYLGYVVTDSDLTAGIGTKSGAYTSAQTLSDAYFTGMQIEDNNTSLSTPRWADINAASTSGNILVIAASVSDDSPEDSFKIQKLDVCAPQNPPPPPVDCVSATYDFTGSSALTGTFGNIRTFTAANGR